MTAEQLSESLSLTPREAVGLTPVLSDYSVEYSPKNQRDSQFNSFLSSRYPGPTTSTWTRLLPWTSVGSQTPLPGSPASCRTIAQCLIYVYLFICLRHHLLQLFYLSVLTISHLVFQISVILIVQYLLLLLTLYQTLNTDPQILHQIRLTGVDEGICEGYISEWCYRNHLVA